MSGPDAVDHAEVRAFLRGVGSLVERGGGGPETVLSVKQRLADLIRLGPSFPAAVKATSTDCYARHLLYRDPHERFEAIVMAWAPGQATPIHDHAGIWCVEGVIGGVVDVTRYDLTRMEGDRRARMVPAGVIHAGLGQCGALIPPLEHHRIANPYGEPAYTLHVYGGRMSSCRVFRDRGDGTYDVESRPLGYVSETPALPSS